MACYSNDIRRMLCLRRKRIHHRASPLLLALICVVATLYFATPEVLFAGAPRSRQESLNQHFGSRALRHAVPKGTVIEMKAPRPGTLWSQGKLEEALRFVEQVVNHEPVLLFMKGTPDLPECGFSAHIVRILNEIGIPYQAVNVLDEAKNPHVRSAAKQFSEWPTFPQLYINGSLIGGSDIVAELYEDGDLRSLLLNQGMHHAAVSETQNLDEMHVDSDVHLVADPSRPIATKMSKALSAAFSLQKMIIVDETRAHRGHHRADSRETNFRLEIVALEFDGLSLVERQQKVYTVLHELMPRIHALSLVTKSPAEV